MPDFVNDYVGWGAGPRASQYLILAGKARALLKGRYHVSTEDIRQVALPVLRHRIVTNFNAEAEGIRSDTIVKKLIDYIPRQQYDELDRTTARLVPEPVAGRGPRKIRSTGVIGMTIDHERHFRTSSPYPRTSSDGGRAAVRGRGAPAKVE